MPKNKSWNNKQILVGEQYQIIKEKYGSSQYRLILSEEEKIKNNSLSESDSKNLKQELDTKQETKAVKGENNEYSKYIQNIENIKFEKIRRYCENLSRKDIADEMQEQLCLKGKMYKALMYSSLEIFIEKLDGKTITLIDWGCGQGIASMLVLDYIKEKQLDIKVSQVILIDDDKRVLIRAIAQVDALSFDNIDILALRSSDIDTLNSSETIENNITLNLIANDKFTVDYLDIDYEKLSQAYFMSVSNVNEEFVDEIYQGITDWMDCEIISCRNSKIGRFEKFERIFSTKSILTIDRDEDEIPF